MTTGVLPTQPHGGAGPAATGRRTPWHRAGQWVRLLAVTWIRSGRLRAGMTTQATGNLEEPWPLVVRLRALADGRPLLVDLAVVVVLNIVTAVPLIGLENRWWVWLFDQALILPLAVRRRAPFGVFVVLCIVAFGQWLADVPLAADAALLLALYTVAAHESRSRGAWSAAVLEAGVILASARFAPAGESLVYSLVFLTGLVVAALFVGVTLRTRRAYLAAVEERARRLEIDRVREARLAVSRERTRIAREMHDIVAHSLSVMIALADGAALLNATDAAQAGEAMATVSATGRQSLREMRRLLAVLREDNSAVDRAPQPSLDQLADLTERVRMVGLDVVLRVSGQPAPLPQTEDATAYRILQESLTNVVKHAQGATRVDIEIVWHPDRIVLSVRDDGRVDGHQGDGGHGIAGMTERASLFGGSLHAGPCQGGVGWRVVADLPVGGS